MKIAPVYRMRLRGSRRKWRNIGFWSFKMCRVSSAPDLIFD
jgi:hypothetical protein